MTIQFYCPNCGSLIAFDSKHAGKRARCLTCGQVLVIPSKDYEKPQKSEPVSGFYRAVFVDNWKIFFDPENATSLLFVIAAVCFKFFLGNAVCCMNYVSHVVVWGWLLGFYLNIIYETAFEIDKLPEIFLGTSITFLWYIIKPFLTFFSTMVAVQLPFIIALILLQDKGITYENMWQAHTGWNFLLQGLFIFGVFLFPIAVLTTAVGNDVTLLRPDYILVPVLKAPLPYLIVVILLAAACVLEMQTTQYDGSPPMITAAHLAINLAVQLIAIIAMRSIGLFYRHYSCHIAW
jgi:hypothetical protein